MSEVANGFRTTLRAWLHAHAAEAPPATMLLDDEGAVETWRGWSATLHAAGYAGITWPERHGGSGLTHRHQAIWLEESARAGIADHLGVIGLDMAGPTIIHWGSEEQKARYLEPILRCEEIWCQGFSEPGSGSDLASVSTSAVADGDEWIVNGQKVWSSFATIADWCIALVRTDPEAPRLHAGLSYLILDMRAPGVEVRPLRQITGDSEFGEIFLTDVRVPRDSMLGKPGDGWRVAMTTLSHERGTHGVALAARLEVAMRAAQPLVALHGDPVAHDRFAQLWVDLRGLHAVNRATLVAMDASGEPGPESTISKLVWSELNQGLTSLMGDVLGTEALERNGEWTYARLRARGNTIEAGTSEVLRNIIAERVLHLPRSR